ncbi:Dna2/Cas4 domain-containing protein [Cohnella sp. GCM10020058]|uniref:CRISPR-associated protein Cas4 n=1 Tax=Cohnella sp. GCM10020058 TaxID=3317330 RepID=UPI003635927D
MLNIQVAEGALFYGERERRVTVLFDDELRGRTAALASAMHETFESAITPAGLYEPKCGGCSLLGICKPKLKRGSVSRYLQSYMTDDTTG